MVLQTSGLQLEYKLKVIKQITIAIMCALILY